MDDERIQDEPGSTTSSEVPPEAPIVTSSGSPSGSGLKPNLAGALSYALGLVTGILFFIIDKDNDFVKFHAMQSILFTVVVIIVDIVLSMIPIIGWVLLPLFGIFVLIVWLMLMWRAYNNEEWELPFVGKIARDQLAK